MVGLGLVSMPKLLPPLQKTAPSSFKVSEAFQLPFAAMNHMTISSAADREVKLAGAHAESLI